MRPITSSTGHPRTRRNSKRFFGESGASGDPEQYLRSPRDNQPYVIIYGSPLDSDGRDIILAYEKDGLDGKRYVITLSRDVKLMTDEEFAGAKFASGLKPSKKK